MRINHNIAALNTYRQLTGNINATSKSLEKLSSGLRINKAGDDAAGLAISEKMRGQIRGLDQAARNANDGISLIQTAEGALSEVHSILQRMRELAVQSTNDTNTPADRAEMQKEVDQLAEEITRISTDTEFNTKKLLNGSMGKVATKTGGAAVLTGLQVVGASLGSGSYTLTLTDSGVNTEVIDEGAQALTAADFGDDAGDITVADNVLYGSYTLTSENLDAGTADFRLVGPDGTITEVSGHNVTEDLVIGGFTFDFSTQNVTKNGTLAFTLEATSIDINLTGDATASVTDFNYRGETLNIGGFQFTLKTNTANVDDAVANYNVIDKSVEFQIGANANQRTSLSINKMDANALGVDGLDLTTKIGADAALGKVDAALNAVSSERAKLGAVQNRLEHTINNLGTTSENLTASESRIRDVDMAKEMMEFTKNNILSQAAQAMLAQANMQPQSVLQLLQ